ncbi:hypothetical protein ACFO0S_01440 [Chryseomicrobium palamuruense]|uniref:Uncharacterized protein n=1 Tax=Chryseomicrobium palamuruense TaxID=682973 RepID=A0ABV8USH7_9BACL
MKAQNGFHKTSLSRQIDSLVDEIGVLSQQIKVLSRETSRLYDERSLGSLGTPDFLGISERACSTFLENYQKSGLLYTSV